MTAENAFLPKPVFNDCECISAQVMMFVFGAVFLVSTAPMNPVRNVGSAIGISVTTAPLSNGVQANQPHLTACAAPFNRALEIDAHPNDFLFMFCATLVVYPLVWMMRRPGYSSSGSRRQAIEAIE